MPSANNPNKPDLFVIFDPAWTLGETRRAIRAEEKHFKHEGGRTSAAALISLSVDSDEKENVGTFEEEAEAPAFRVVLVDEVPTDEDDRALFFQTLNRRGLELICFSDLKVQGKLIEVAVCRAIADTSAPAVSTGGSAGTSTTPVNPPSPSAPLATGLISQDAFNLILEFEGVDQPGRWPGASSGISLGVGYDLGYVTAAQFRNDWGSHLTGPQLERLTRAIGLKGDAAKNAAPRFADIKVSRAMSMEVFNRCTLPQYTEITRRAFPGMEKLPLNAQGALLSLVFNRGASMTGSRRREMAEIRDIVRNGNPATNLAGMLREIGKQIRSMKRLWDINELRGLHRRRDAEASLVEASLANPGNLIQITASAVGAAVAGGVSTVLQPNATGPSGRMLVDLARKHCNVGEKYRLGAFVPKNKKDATGPWDCAEFVSWCVYQVAGFLVGCERNDGNPATADAWTGYWQRDASICGRKVSVEEAARIPGAVVLRYPPSTGTGHIVLSDGRGGTLEAKGTQFGVVTDKISGRRWDTGILLNGIFYDGAGGPVAVNAPAKVYFVGALGMDGAVVTTIQQKLRDAGFDPGPIDGEYGDLTADAVLAFQTQHNLLADGEVGPDTAKVLGVQV